jgi:hypothetical protein
MKIVPKNKGRCILEVDELLEMSAWRDQEELIAMIRAQAEKVTMNGCFLISKVQKTLYSCID